jgi:hypothetical protein
MSSLTWMRMSPRNDGSGDDARASRLSRPTTVVAALSDCRAALERTFTGLRDGAPRHQALDRVRSSVERFAEVTAEHQIPPERVIVMLKRSVRELPAIRQWLETDREALSHQLVEMVIAAYYGDGDGKNRR